MKKTLVFGASIYAHRYSNLAIRRLVQKEITTVAFGLRKGEVAGVHIGTNLRDMEDLHTITLYMNPRNQKAFYNDLIRLQPKRIIFNPGTENPELDALLREEGIEVVVGCTLVMLATGQY